MKTEDNMAQKSATGGFAPAVQPTASTTILTHSEAIHSGETSVPSQGKTCQRIMPGQKSMKAHCQWC